MAHDDVREQGYDNGLATSGGVIVVAAFTMVLVCVIWVGVAGALALCACLACSASSLVLSSVVDK